MDRRAELAANLDAVERRLSAACEAAGRDRAEVTLVAVTKTFPLDDVRLLAELGVTDVAENRDQEARGKAAGFSGVRWHFVGQLQRNKARSVARYADVVHSVDRSELAAALGAAAARHRQAPLDVLLQVNLDPASAPDRGGVRPDDLLTLAAATVEQPALRLRGVMAVAPLGGDPNPAFARLATLSDALQGRFSGAVWISAGMSGDLESGIEHGATHVRVGSALLGRREGLRGTVAG